MKIYPMALLAGLLMGSLSPALAQAPAGGQACAMVVMHGKWGGPRFLEGFAYARALPHPQSTYLVVQADHKDTPEVATAQVLAWVRQVVSP